MDTAKISIFRDVAFTLIDRGFRIDRFDQSISWGGFFVVNESQSQLFTHSYFHELEGQHIHLTGRISPMIIIVAPGKQQTWRYHVRRAEFWKVVKGNVGVIQSENDQPGEQRIVREGELLRLKEQERHRFIGLDEWAVLAEIWQHTSAQWPSDEYDVVRLQDEMKIS